MSTRPEKLTEIRDREVSVITGHKFFLLFVFLLLYLILYPYTQNKGVAYYTLRVLGIGITLLSVYAISFRRSLVFVGMALAVPAVLEHLRIARWDASAMSMLTIALTLAFDTFIIVVIFHRVFVHKQPTAETIYGALCIYLLVGLGFASLYTLLAAVQPHAFYLDPITSFNATLNRFDFIYYSFGTMTCLGANGISAVSNQAKSLSLIEAILGVLYLAVLISRLVGAHYSASTER
ncbi:MAG TPA: ion channel [Acidobacteriaceae bacterium]|nr:ion channel [Acidobacteriaceae bacterium]